MADQNEPTRILKAKVAVFRPRQALFPMICAGLAVAVSVFLLTVDHSLTHRLLSWAAIAFFGGGGLLVVLTWLLPALPALRLDERNLTLLAHSEMFQRLPLVGRFVGRSITIPWADIAAFTIVTFPLETFPLSSGSAVRASGQLRFVGIIPREFDSIAAPNVLQRKLRDFVQREFGAFPTPLGLEMSADDLLPLLQRYQAAAQRRT